MARARARVYEIRTTFRAPLPFVFRWCTDYSPRDPGLHRGAYRRKIVERSERRVVFEDLYDEPNGWAWSRGVSELHPPDRWHAEERGNWRAWSIDYRLRSLAPERTELTIRGRRTPTAIGPPNPAKRTFERELRGIWRGFGRALERDYRRERRSRRVSARAG
jgi:hypothetical protein